MLEITPALSIEFDEINMTAIRAQGAGGQNVNKVSSAIHLRFDVKASSLPIDIQQRLLSGNDSRISKNGIVVIKAQSFRTQDKNRADALQRLQHLIQQATHVVKARKPTRVSRTTKQKRMDVKTQRGRLKQLRSKVID